MDPYRNPGFHHGSVYKSWISVWINIEIQYTEYPRYRYRLKYSFDTDLSVKLYPEYNKSNIQVVSKIQIQIEKQFLYRLFIHQIVSRIQYTDCFDTDLSMKFYPSIQIVSVKLYPSICSLGSISYVCI